MTVMKTAKKPTNAVVDHFSNVSSQWSSFYRGSMEQISEWDLHGRRKAALNFLRQIQADADGPLSVLDVGCGSGDVLSALDDKHWKIHGIDFVAGMVQQASKQYPSSGLAVADAVHMPFRSASMDVVTCLGVLEYVPSWEGALNSIARVLKPGGHFVVSFPNRQSWFRRWGHLEAWMLRGVRNIFRPGSSRDKNRYARTEWTHRDTVDILVRHGFRVEDVVFKTYGLKGRIGDRSKMNLKIAKTFDGKGVGNSIWSRNFAWTMVFACTRSCGSLPGHPQSGHQSVYARAPGCK